MTQVQTQRVVRLDGSSHIVEVPDPAPAVIGAPTTTDYGGVKLGATIAAPAAMTATADTASSASDVAGLLTDHNDLVSKYNALLNDTTALRTTLAAVLAQLKAKTIPV
ncbi:phenylalanyl-tRNA synthetase subunit beta [Salmonella enterica]|uniref:phenylalanyl-tRNA synthetase subunit beta n=1 Tax=Salmonella enterica TaxID=28901 RepID=UPI0009AAAD3B|nr:phenylalanyl-tRNA synthetase subunit beta [Salmonella enterica]EEC0893050.1 phenylalanyl-tRNA synthetase subunit beta [Salmonella enterica subsp. enterica]EAM7588982.1 phenylalanyl-tRNA synthetase subunit beta [Salmonella enterica]EAO9226444.1 phenylalanyl-tRNA synthetase subunit beta [Salmonella enterica]EAP9689832.1 phenylalanyl-tRNA synthetase subunit beta [Salmonella enterica subsp. enterica serovar Johannesburg]EAV5408450.1 phenylalanyl-tRNA synthetase subunit beta [Salmonella enterica